APGWRGPAPALYRPRRTPLSLQVDLRWLAGDLASCFRAAECLIHKQPLADPALADALAPPAGRLLAALHEERITPDRFFSNLIPQSVGINSPHQLAEVTL